MDRNLNLNYVFCDLGEETPINIFLHCNVVDRVWKKGHEVVLDFNFITPYNLFVDLACWVEEVRFCKLRKGLLLIWHTSLWIIWRARNDFIFNNRVEGR